MSVTQDIRAALEGRLTGVTGLPAARAWEGVAFTPTEGTPWVSARLQVTSRLPASIGTTPLYRWQGLFLVDVVYPFGSGPAALDAMADLVVARFPAPLDIQRNSVVVGIRWSAAGAGLRDAGWIRKPVTVAWRCDTHTE